MDASPASCAGAAARASMPPPRRGGGGVEEAEVEMTRCGTALASAAFLFEI